MNAPRNGGTRSSIRGQRVAQLPNEHVPVRKLTHKASGVTRRKSHAFHDASPVPIARPRIPKLLRHRDAS